MSIRFPPSRQPIAGGFVIDPHWERWFGDLAREVNDAGSSTPAPPVEIPSFVVSGAGSVTADGSVAGGEFVVTLVGDADNPLPGSLYGVDASGNKGFVPLYDGLEEGEGIALLDGGYTIIDTVATPDDLPLTGNTGEAVRVTESEVGIYAWDGSAFTLDAAATGVVNVALAPLADAGTGTSLKKIVRDAYGRTSATEDANLNDVADVDSSAPNDGDVLTFDSSTSKWIPEAPTGGAGIQLSGRVSIYSSLPAGLGSGDAGAAYLVDADGLVYVWDGSAWPSSGAGVAVGSQAKVCKLSLSADISAPSSPSVYNVVWDVEDVDEAGWHDSVNKTRVTVDKPGLYCISFQHRVTSGTISVFPQIFLNGVALAEVQRTAIGAGQIATAVAYLRLVAGDYVECGKNDAASITYSGGSAARTSLTVAGPL